MTPGSSVSSAFDRPRRRDALGVLLTLAGLVAAVWLAGAFHPFGFQLRMVSALSFRVFVQSLRNLLLHTVLTPEFFIVVVFTLALERLFPADPEQRIFSPSFAQDAAWFFYETMLQALVIATYVEILIRLYHRHFEYLTITAADHWPGWVRFLLSLLLLDLLYWCQHFMNHKVPFLWRFHTVHHSQQQLNFFTDYRYHVFEYIVRQTWLVIPFLVLQVHAPTIVWFAIIGRWYTRFYHGNIRTNLGPLRHLLVTPQSHRIHHSIDPRHRDSNFGSLFSIWDRLFGTLHPDDDVYPETGVDDAGFPHETVRGLAWTPVRPLIQMAYPIRYLLRRELSHPRAPLDSVVES